MKENTPHLVDRLKDACKQLILTAIESVSTALDRARVRGSHSIDVTLDNLNELRLLRTEDERPERIIDQCLPLFRQRRFRAGERGGALRVTNL